MKAGEDHARRAGNADERRGPGDNLSQYGAQSVRSHYLVIVRCVRSPTALRVPAGPMPGRFSRASGSNYAAKPRDYNVEVLESAPTRAFEEVARLDVHIEPAFFAQPSLKEAMPELLKQARLSGADVIINIQERKSALNESRILHVTATGIKYKGDR